MKFGFVAGKTLKSYEQLAAHAQTRGHEVVHVPLRDMPVSAEGITNFVKDCASQFDAVHYYAGIADSIGIFFGKACDELGVPLLNNRAHIPHLTHDKMFQAYSFSCAGLAIPKTEFTRKPNWEKLQATLGSPVIAKRVRGTHGNHVHKITDQADLDEIKEPSWYLFQEYLPHRNDVRVLVLNGKAVCGYRRVPSEGDFRANLARGGHAEALADQTEKETVFKLAEAAIAAVPYDLAGIDLIKSETDGQYRLIEINVNPSWSDIAGAIDVCFEDVLLDAYESLAAKR